MTSRTETTAAEIRMRKLDYARGLDTAAAERRAEVSRLRAIIRATEAEVERIEDRAGEIRRELASNG